MSSSVIQLHRPGQLQLSALPPLTLYIHLPWCLRTTTTSTNPGTC